MACATEHGYLLEFGHRVIIEELHKKLVCPKCTQPINTAQKTEIDYLFWVDHCALCGDPINTFAQYCEECLNDPDAESSDPD